DGVGSLIPEHHLRPAVPVKISHDLVGMLRGSGSLHEVTLPRRSGIVVRIRVFPPPDLVQFPVAAHDDVHTAVGIDDAGRAARLDMQRPRFDQILRPTSLASSVPDERGRALAYG